MKKTPMESSRKHGYKARAEVIDRRLHLNSFGETHCADAGERLKTNLRCSSSGQAYFWFTDRGRSRLIKH
jgi:hypothetical protein